MLQTIEVKIHRLALTAQLQPYPRYSSLMSRGHIKPLPLPQLQQGVGLGLYPSSAESLLPRLQ